MLEIIPEGEVAQHFKKGPVPVRLADILNIAGTDALLAGSHPLAGRNLLSCKIRLERRHA